MTVTIIAQVQETQEYIICSNGRYVSRSIYHQLLAELEQALQLEVVSSVLSMTHIAVLYLLCDHYKVSPLPGFTFPLSL